MNGGSVSRPRHEWISRKGVTYACKCQSQKNRFLPEQQQRPTQHLKVAAAPARQGPRSCSLSHLSVNTTHTELRGRTASPRSFQIAWYVSPLHLKSGSVCKATTPTCAATQSEGFFVQPVHSSCSEGALAKGRAAQ